MRRARRVGWWAGLLLLVVTPLVGGCEDEPAPRSDLTGRYDRYVALGDSFTSGAGLPQTVRSGGDCGRSRLGYPTLVARALDAELADVSCGGASTDNGIQPQDTGAETHPPQLDAVTEDTDLVTVSLGGNDAGWFLGVMFSCTTVAGQDPDGSPCKDQSPGAGAEPEALPRLIGERLTALLEEVHRRAPGADVLVVGYPQLVPESGSCPDLPLATGDYPWVRDQWIELHDAMQQAAEDTDSTFVDVLEASDGHDVCAGDDAWVNGAAERPGVAASYHPFERGQRAVADLVLKALAD